MAGKMRIQSGIHKNSHSLDSSSIFFEAAFKGVPCLGNASIYYLKRYGIRLEQARAMLQPVKLGVRYLYNQSLNSIWSVGPKLIMAILLIPPLLTALGAVREKKSGSIIVLGCFLKGSGATAVRL
jgi:hypothetical protein